MPSAKQRVVFHRGLALLTCRDEGLLDELLLLPGMRAALVRLLSPRAALVDPSRLEELTDLLRERGYPPRLAD